MTKGMVERIRGREGEERSVIGHCMLPIWKNTNFRLLSYDPLVEVVEVVVDSISMH